MTTTEKPSPGLTREQRIVHRLARLLPGDARELGGVEARSQALPALLRRHGPVQVLLFLAAKGGDDAKLADWLMQGIFAALGTRTEGRLDIGGRAEELARTELAAYLLHWEIALEVAGWLKMLIGARLEEGKQPGPTPETPVPGEVASSGAVAP